MPVQRYNTVVGAMMPAVWTQRVFDQFTDADSTPFHNHTPNQGSGYSDISVGWVIFFNAASATNNPSIVVNDTILKPNQAASLQYIASQHFEISILARVIGTSVSDWCGYAARYEVSPVDRILLCRVDNGVFTQIGDSVAMTLSNSTLRIECVRNRIAFLVDDVEKVVAIDSTYRSGKIGLESTGNVTGDNFRGFDLPGHNSGHSNLGGV